MTLVRGSLREYDAGMREIRRLALFCGSSEGSDIRYRQAALQMANLLYQDQITMVYGGGNRGLMGIAASELTSLGGTVIGILPKILDRSDVRTAQVEKELIICATMHERKAKMYELSDAFIAMAGGIGTFEEILEIFTWLQLGLHTKAVALLNTAGFYDPLIAFLHHSKGQGFIKAELLDALIVEEDPALLLERIKTFSVHLGDKLGGEQRA